jgi:hypothetical protein
VHTGLTLRGIVAFKHDVHGIVERKNVFFFVAIKDEGLRAYAEELVKKTFCIEVLKSYSQIASLYS